MKSRQDYENDFKNTLVTAGEERHIRMQLDILLDIRELLLEEKEERDLKRITEERVRMEQARMVRVADMSSD